MESFIPLPQVFIRWHSYSFCALLSLALAGAPYLPTFQKGLNAMFTQLRNEPSFMKRRHCTERAQLVFVDLGSGDGRVVFRAAREELFGTSVGYELNPLLHGWASLQRWCRGPSVWSTTRFYRASLWQVNLRNADVVAVVRCPLCFGHGSALPPRLSC